MTNISRANPTGTATYTPPASTGQRDIFGLASPAQPMSLGELGPARFELTGSDREHRVQGWRLTIYDLRGGLNTVRGSFAGTHARSSSSTLDTRFAGYATLPLLTTVQTTPDPGYESGGDALQVSHLNIFDTLAIAAGGNANSCLFKETSGTDPALVALTYTFNVGATNHNIYGLASVAINSQEARLCVYGAGPAEVLSNVGNTPTVAGTITDSLLCKGIIQTPLTDQPILFYQSKQLGSLLSTSAYAASITKTINVPSSGGYVVGMSSLAGGRLRVYWVFPRQDSIVGMLEMGAEDAGDLYSTNLEGSDLALHDLPLRWVNLAAIYRDGIVAHDGRRIVFTNGRMLRDLRVFADRVPNSDRELRVRGFTINGPELIARLCEIAVSGGTGATVEWEESYDFDLDAWLPVSGQTTLSTTGVQGLNSPGPSPISFTTGYRHHYTDGAWRRTLTTPYGTNPFTLRKTAGAASGTGQAFAASGTWTSPKWTLPGLEGAPFVVSRVSFGGDVDAAGTDSTAGHVEVAIADNSGAFTNKVAHFVTGHPNWRQLTKFDPVQQEQIYELQVRITATQQSGGTDPTRYTPNCLPVVIEGYAFLEERQLPPPRLDRTR